MGLRTVNSIMMEIALHLVEPCVITAITADVAAGTQTVTVTSTVGMYAGAQVVIDDAGGGNPTILVISAFDPIALTVTGNFLDPYAAGSTLLGATFPTQQPTDPLFTQAEIIGYIARAQNEFLSKLPGVFDFFRQPLATGQTFYTLPPTAIETDRVAIATSQGTADVTFVSRTAGLVTATLSASSGVAANTTIVIAGIPDATFNGIFTTRTVSADGLTVTWLQYGEPDATSPGSSPSGTPLEQDYLASNQPQLGTFFGLSPTQPTGMSVAVSVGQVLSSFVITQPDTKLFLTFYDAALVPLQVVDLSTVGATLSAPASSESFIITCDDATVGATYALTFDLEGESYSYTVVPNSGNYETDFGGPDSMTAINPTPFGTAAVGGLFEVTAVGGSSNPFHLNFYTASRQLISTTPAVVGSYPAPALAAFWALTVDNTIPVNDAANITLMNSSAATQGTLTWEILTRMYEVSQQELTMRDPQWFYNTSNPIPTSWYEDRTGIYGWGVAGVPQSNFSVELMCSVRASEDLVLTDTFLVPDVMIHGVKYLALAWAWQKDGEQRSPTMARSALTRYNRVLMAADRYLRNIIDATQGR